jgi:hypothetical protein
MMRKKNYIAWLGMIVFALMIATGGCGGGGSDGGSDLDNGGDTPDTPSPEGLFFYVWDVTTGQAGIPVSGAEVTFTMPDSSSYTETTDAEGKVPLRLPAGREYFITVVVTAAGYYPVEEQVFIETNLPLQLGVGMLRM